MSPRASTSRWRSSPEDRGAATALKVAKRLVVVAQRRGGQSQFSAYLAAPSIADDDPLARVQAHVMAHLRDGLAVEDLAAITGMSSRHFARIFVQDTGSGLAPATP